MQLKHLLKLISWLIQEKIILRVFGYACIYSCKRIKHTHIYVHLNLLVRYVVVHFSFYDFQLVKHFLHIAFCFVSPAHCFGIFSHIYFARFCFSSLRSIFVLTFFPFFHFFFHSSLICLQVFFSVLSCFRTAF